MTEIQKESRERMRYFERCRKVCNVLQVQLQGVDYKNGFGYYPSEGGGKFHMSHSVMEKIEEMILALEATKSAFASQQIYDKCPIDLIKKVLG